MPLSDSIIAASKRRLVRETDRYLKLVRVVEVECSSLVRENGIHASIQSRVKKPDSLEAKLRRYVTDGNIEKIEGVNSDEDVFRIVGDIAAVRVATYVEGDRERVVRLLESRFKDVDVERHSKPSGYRATHCQILLPDSLLRGEQNANISDLSCEVQVCSMLAHVWNEIEHDIRYKTVGASEVDDYERSRLQSLLDVMRDGDGAIEELLTWRSARIAEALVEPVSLRFPSCTDFRQAAVYVLREAARLGYTSLDRLADSLLVGDYQSAGRSAIQTINSALDAAGEAASALNPQTSDILLALLLRQHHADICGLHFTETQSRDKRRIPFLAEFVDEHALFS